MTPLRLSRARLRPLTWVAALAALGGCAHSPSMFRPHGTMATHIASLGWYLVIVASAVVLIVTVLVVVAIMKGRPEEPPAEAAEERSGVPWIWWGGFIAPALILIATLVLVLITIAQTGTPPKSATLTVKVIAHRWWWEFQYLGPSRNDRTVTANELHVPLGQPVRIELSSADVIHSFWVPELIGKTDVIPGQTNVTWIEAAEPGIYRGECGEYCGVQHAHMDFEVVAQPTAQFQAWLSHEASPAATPSDPAAARGRNVFMSGPCSLCHTVRGTPAHGQVGPDLTHVASRSTIGAGTLPLTRGNLAGWIANSQALKPGNYMPTLYLTPGDLHAVVAYLETLR